MRKYFKMSAFFCVILVIGFGCASFEKISERVLPKDTYSRTYDLNFISFHPKLNSFLQEYARQNKGNSFQIRYLGNAEVIWRGIFKLKNSSDSFLMEIFSKPASRNKSKLEIKFLGDPSSGAGASWPRAADEFFRVVEEGMKISPPNN